MTKSFYPRIAASNLVKNGIFYLPYILTVVFSAAVFYIVLAMAGMPLGDMLRYNYLSNYMSLGSVILGLFIFILLNYTNSFLMKRRNKELGLYNVLGMGKGNIAKVLFFEGVYTWLIGTGGGLILGVLLLKLVLMLAAKILNFDAPKAYFSAPAAEMTAILFGSIMLIVLLKNLWKLKKLNTVELLRENNVGEREPKTRWIMTVAGVLTLGGGYYLALTTENAMLAIQYYFIAVLLVIIGTYCLFSAVSIAVLKLLRNNKKFYYKTGHFIGVSGMIHRMNRNAVGLANICILSTMVLVMISGTLSLYLGIDETVEINHNSDIALSVKNNDNQDLNLEFTDIIENTAEKENLTVENLENYQCLKLLFNLDGDVYRSVTRETIDDYCSFIFISLNDYNRIFNKNAVLEKGQAIITGANAASDTLKLSFGPKDSNKKVDLSYELLQGSIELTSNGFARLMNYSPIYIALPEIEDVIELYNINNELGEMKSDLTDEYNFDVSGDEDQEIGYFNALNTAMVQATEGKASNYFLTSRENDREIYNETNGGFLLLGLILSAVFLAAMVLIMYYRQISDGYEDKERFLVMQQVGLSKKEIKKSINLQVLTVFFAPLAVAGIHIIMDFNLMRLLLQLFDVVNWKLTVLCTACSFGVFALFYGIIYALTAKTYYKIVSEKNTD